MEQYHETILVVEDDVQIRNFICYALKAEGFRCVTAGNAATAMKQLLAEPVDMMLLDLGLPDMDGGEVLKKVREWSEMPIIIVSARDQDREKAAMLDLGADDYLTKPFSVLQLRARVEAHLRRERRVPSYRFVSGGLRFDLQAKKVYAGEQELSLTRSEYMLCETLARHPGLVYTREQLLEEVFGFDSDSGEAAVTEHIKNLRGKLASCGSAPIETVWGMGYRWNSEKA